MSGSPPPPQHRVVVVVVVVVLVVVVVAAAAVVVAVQLQLPFLPEQCHYNAFRALDIVEIHRDSTVIRSVDSVSSSSSLSFFLLVVDSIEDVVPSLDSPQYYQQRSRWRPLDGRNVRLRSNARYECDDREHGAKRETHDAIRRRTRRVEPLRQEQQFRSP